MGAGHDHGTGEIKHEKPLWIAFGLTAAFLIAEVIGGIMTNSLALLSDAAHMATDVIALAISLFAVRLSRRPSDAKRTYGYARMEAIGAMINGVLLFVVAFYILWEAMGRFSDPPEVASTGMLVIATLGLTCTQRAGISRTVTSECVASNALELNLVRIRLSRSTTWISSVGCKNSSGSSTRIRLFLRMAPRILITT